MEKVVWILMLIAFVVGGLSGCGSTRGWRVTFGVAPVASLDDHQGLKQETKVERY